MTRDQERRIASAVESTVVDRPTSYDEALDQYHAWAKELLRKGIRTEPFAHILLEIRDPLLREGIISV